MIDWNCPPLVSFIIVNWNGAKDLPDCLQSIYGQSYQPIEIVVVDNGSTDQSLKYLESQPDIILLKNRENRGFAAANNQGISRARGDWIFLLNTDAKLKPECLQRMMQRVLEEETIGSATPKVFRLDERTLDTTGIVLQKKRFSPADRGENEVDQGQYDSDSCEEIFGPSAAAALYRRKALGDVSGGREIFDEDFFAYYEDVDLAWRLRLMGWQSIYIHEAVCTHLRRGPAKKPRTLQHQAFANRYFCYIKNESLTCLSSFFFQAAFYESARLIKFLFTRPHMLVSYLILLKSLPSMLRKRRWIQSTRKVGSRDLQQFI